MTIRVPYYKSEKEIQCELDKPLINFGYTGYTDFIKHLISLQQAKILVSYYSDTTSTEIFIFKLYFKNNKTLNSVYDYFGYSSFEHFHKTLKGLKAEIHYGNFSMTLKLLRDIM